MKLHLVDINPRLVNAWRRSFAEHPEVEVGCADILSVAEHCIVSPANSHGYMDGGIDLHYRNYFGGSIERTVRDAIGRRPEGVLPVGAALAIRTGDSRIPFMIVAPTMEMPESVPAQHCSRAMWAILRTLDRNPEINGSVYCPGLATLTGRVDPSEAAEHMASAYRDWLEREG